MQLLARLEKSLGPAPDEDQFVDEINVPVLLVEAWQDEQVGSRAANLSERFSPDIPWRLLASNGDHGE